MAQAKIVGILKTLPDGTQKYDTTAAIIESNIRSGIIPNVINSNLPATAHLRDCKVGVNLLKTMNDSKEPIATFNKFVRGRVNPNHGGYYYAYAYQNDGYVEASCRIPLSKCSVSKVAGKRRAFVSIGVLCNGSMYRFFDVGLANDGYGWYPMVYGMNVYKRNEADTQYIFNGGIQYHPTTTGLKVRTNLDEIGTIFPSNGDVSIKLEAGVYPERDYVRITYTCGSLTGTLAFNAPKGTMHSRSGGKPVVRFYRFMSLVPLKGDGENDVADKSALSAGMDSLKLGTAVWDATKIQHSYASQIENVKKLSVSTLTSSSVGTNADYCHIYHDTPTHPTA